MVLKELFDVLYIRYCDILGTHDRWKSRTFSRTYVYSKNLIYDYRQEDECRRNAEIWHLGTEIDSPSSLSHGKSESIPVPNSAKASSQFLSLKHRTRLSVYIVVRNPFSKWSFRKLRSRLNRKSDRKFSWRTSTSQSLDVRLQEEKKRSRLKDKTALKAPLVSRATNNEL